MKICYYTPFKPLTHAHLSGDLVTATGIFSYLKKQGHQVIPASDLRCRWIYWKPWIWPKLLLETRRVVQQNSGNGMDLWLTYHSYYKAPDLLGAAAAKKMGIPYVIFQGIYSTKRRRAWKTRPGFYLNRRSLCAARHIFTNKRLDLLNLKRLIPENKITYIAPGLIPDDFTFDAGARAEIRRTLNLSDEPVVFSAAMFRPDVKTEGLTWVIRTCGEIYRRGNPLWLIIAGDGKEKEKLQQLNRTRTSARDSSESPHFSASVCDTIAGTWPMCICRSVFVSSAAFPAVKCTDIIALVICLFFRGSGNLWAWCFSKRRPAGFRWSLLIMPVCRKP